MWERSWQGRVFNPVRRSQAPLVIWAFRARNSECAEEGVAARSPNGEVAGPGADLTGSVAVDRLRDTITGGHADATPPAGCPCEG
ncbi:hypothetical protein SHL15_6147 [Streptomyces hygroscopicus subsp. limoneus]|nr:hypothetical protein SHL15_6147 [Streptomyces hygroscopicus subsp. limoneus]